jgi:hypothetical protein
MTSTEPTIPKRSGPERGWSRKLWDAYVDVGESDAGSVESCNRFLKAMVCYRLHETVELIRSLFHLFVLKGEAPNPERYLSGVPEIDLEERRKANLQDELDVYRVWWGEHVRWEKAKDCLCERKPVELDPQSGLLSPKVEQRQRIWRTHPMFLSACVQVARRSLVEDGFSNLEYYTRQGELEDEPTPEGEALWVTINRRMEAYLASGQWRIDDAPLEDLTDSLGGAFNVIRQPKESRKDYIIRVKDRLDDRLIRAMQKSTEMALHPKVKLRAGPPLETRLRHEDMLVLRLFGVGNPARTITRSEIVQAMPDAFLKEDGEPVAYPKAEVSRRTDLIGKYLGFLAAGGKTS